MSNNKWVYTHTTRSITQVPGMEKPECWSNKNEGLGVNCEKCTEYAKHIAQLKTYHADWPEEMDGREIGDKDFRLQWQSYDFHLRYWEDITEDDYETAREDTRRITALLTPLKQEEEKGSEDGKLWIKIGNDIIQPFDRNKLGENVFEVDTNGLLFQITNDDGTFKVTNAVDGYGINRRKDFENYKVTFLTEDSPIIKVTGKTYTGNPPASQPIPGTQEGVEEAAKEYADRELPMREFYQSNIGRGLAEQERKGFIRGFLTGSSWQSSRNGKDAIEFAKWVYEQEYIYDEESNRWGWNGCQEGQELKSDELYQLYLTSKK